jgi:hypothetical protein
MISTALRQRRSLVVCSPQALSVGAYDKDARKNPIAETWTPEGLAVFLGCAPGIRTDNLKSRFASPPLRKSRPPEALWSCDQSMTVRTPAAKLPPAFASRFTSICSHQGGQHE